MPAPGPTPTSQPKRVAQRGLHGRFKEPVRQRTGSEHGKGAGNLGNQPAGGKDAPLHVGRHLGLPDGLIRTIQNGDKER